MINKKTVRETPSPPSWKKEKDHLLDVFTLLPSKKGFDPRMIEGVEQLPRLHSLLPSNDKALLAQGGSLSCTVRVSLE